MSDPVLTPMPEPLRRIEVFTGAGRRRVFSAEERGQIIAESYGESATVSGVARRHGLTASQLFAWRRNARKALAQETAGTVSFAPVVVGAGKVAKRVGASVALRRDERPKAGSVIEIAIGCVVVRVGHGADSRLLGSVFEALKHSGL
jgi:transposase